MEPFSSCDRLIGMKKELIMGCHKTIKHLDDYFDGSLGQDLLNVVQNHVNKCPECHELFQEEKAFRLALFNMPAATPSREFSEIAFRNAAALHQKKLRSRAWYSMAGTLAAGLMVWLTTMFSGPIMPGSGITADITLALNETQNIKVLFDSPRVLQDATLTLVIPKELDLVDYPDTRELSWTADLKQGPNMLTLPVRAIEAGNIVLVTRVAHDNQSSTQSFHLAVRADSLVERRLDLLQTV